MREIDLSFPLSYLERSVIYLSLSSINFLKTTMSDIQLKIEK